MYKAIWIDDSVASPLYGSQGYAYPQTDLQGVLWRFKPNGDSTTYYCELEQLKILSNRRRSPRIPLGGNRRVGRG